MSEPTKASDEADQWRDAVGRALYGDAWDTDDLADGISDLIPLIRPVEDWKAHADANTERDHLQAWKDDALDQFGRWDEVFDLVDDGSPSNLGRRKQNIVAEHIDLMRSEIVRLRSTIEQHRERYRVMSNEGINADRALWEVIDDDDAVIPTETNQ